MIDYYFLTEVFTQSIMPKLAKISLMVCLHISWMSFKRNKKHWKVFRLDILFPQLKVLLISEYFLNKEKQFTGIWKLVCL